MKTIIGLLSTHYVERLAAFYFFDPPRVFWGLWAASKGLLPEVRSAGTPGPAAATVQGTESSVHVAVASNAHVKGPHSSHNSTPPLIHK